MSTKQPIGKPRKSAVRYVFADRALFGIACVTGVCIAELICITVLAVCRVDVPDLLWSALLATVTILGGVVGAQRLNGVVDRQSSK